jgi:hypothetical protein
MQCKYCRKRVYVSHICSYCRDYYCIEHREPKTHSCPMFQQCSKPSLGPQTLELQRPTTMISGQAGSRFTTRMNIQRNFFAIVFAFVVLEEILRQISYTKTSPLLEPNIYVTTASQWLSPYLASPLLFLTTCLILFATRRFAKKRNLNNPYMSILKTAVPLGIYTTISIVYACSIAGWFRILLT